MALKSSLNIKVILFVGVVIAVVVIMAVVLLTSDSMSSTGVDGQPTHGINGNGDLEWPLVRDGVINIGGIEIIINEIPESIRDEVLTNSWKMSPQNTLSYLYDHGYPVHAFDATRPPA